MGAAIKKESEPNRGGRPRGRFDATIDWAGIERLFVVGYPVPMGEPAVYPTMTELATRARTSKQNLSQHAKRYEWLEKRRLHEVARLQQGSSVAIVDGVNTTSTLANPAGLAARDPLAILDDVIGRFDQALTKGTLRTDTVADLDRVLRLRSHLVSEGAKSKVERQAMTLEEMQGRHRAIRERVAEFDDAVLGVLSVEQEEAADAAVPVACDVTPIESARARSQPAPVVVEVDDDGDDGVDLLDLEAIAESV